MQIVNCCYPNLNQLNNDSINSSLNLTDDITKEISITTEPKVILEANYNRKIIKIYNLGLSLPNSVLWLRFGPDITLLNGSFPLRSNHFVIDTLQANKALSGVCNIGSATLRVTEVNKT